MYVEDTFATKRVAMTHGTGKLVACGFTLMEMLLVLAIMGLIMAITIPLIADTDGDLAMAGAQMVMRDLEFARSEAIRTQASVTVSFSKANNTYTLNDGTANLTSPFTNQVYPASPADEVGDPRITVHDVQLDGSDSVTFSSLGEPLDSGTGTPMTGDQWIKIRCGEAEVQVDITPLLGQPYIDD
jgi:prepilin-type N-terminal cleavage/methylation domain-containing protein